MNAYLIAVPPQSPAHIAVDGGMGYVIEECDFSADWHSAYHVDSEAEEDRILARDPQTLHQGALVHSIILARRSEHCECVEEPAAVTA